MTDPLNSVAIFNPMPSARGGPEVSTKQDEKKLEAACRDFESLFVNYLMQKMRDTIPENRLLGGGQAEKIYTSMLDNEVSKSVSQHRGMGLAAIMYAQMSSMEESENTKK